MLYTSDARPIGAAMIWSLGRNAQAIAIGSTAGEGQAGSGNGPLDWDEFHRDLIVASHFSRTIGIYNLEGCIRQGFLQRLQTMDWSQSVIIPSASVTRAEWVGRIFRVTLWTASHLVYFLFAAVVFLVWLISHRRFRKKAAPGK